ncbi:MAG: Sua5 YciO YrdC YwlC family protein [Arcobacter sp.]|nr:MAG: Sua5 YciO YrdC YwlC family protein [Arcobacter sp.]
MNNKVFLVQTDTTVGFLSQNSQSLAEIKERPPHKPFVQVTSTFKTLKTMVRVPLFHKNTVRRGKKQTFVYSNNKAIRVVKDKDHARFIKPFGWFYSTSANEKALSYNKEFAEASSDIIIENIKGLFEGESSSIYKLGKIKMRRLR